MTLPSAIEDGLDARRPVEAPDVIRGRVEHADRTDTARDGDSRLIGVAPSVTDFSYCCYLSDRAVDRDGQNHGIGKELVARTKEAAGGATITPVLFSAPDGMEYYPRAGLEKFDNGFGPRRT